MIQEFLLLNRRRFRGPLLSREERDRWSELRWRIEDAMCGSAARHGHRRQALRVPSSLKVDCDHELGSAREISERGILLVTDRPFAVGTPLNLRLIGDRGETVEVEGAVVWVRRPGSSDGPPGVGIEFAALDASQREAVAYLVEEALAALDPGGP
jgi:Tfp pilus assembly protein PilZ